MDSARPSLRPPLRSPSARAPPPVIDRMPSSALTDIPAAILARVPPNDEDAELALLGSLLLDG